MIKNFKDTRNEVYHIDQILDHRIKEENLEDDDLHVLACQSNSYWVV